MKLNFIFICNKLIIVLYFFYSPDVEFCGYTVPHPAEAKMHFRIQAKKGRAVDILRRGLEDLSKVCDHTMKTFEKAMEEHKNTNGMDAS